MRRPGYKARAHRRNTVRAMLMTGVISMKYFTERVRWDYRIPLTFSLSFSRDENFFSSMVEIAARRNAVWRC